MPMFSRVLVVDDSKVDRRLVGGLLEKDPLIQVEYAEDGLEALGQIRELKPQLVITDLRMPQMDGLGLVRAVHRDFPQMPVILMTAHGSGSIALQALNHGASSYLPKAQLVDRLLDRVHEVLGKTKDRSNLDRLMEFQDRAEYTFTLENRPSFVNALTTLVQQHAATMHLLDAADRMRVAVALEQAFLNALYHGNLELSNEELREDSRKLAEGKRMNLVKQRRSEPPYRDRKIFVSLAISRAEIRIVIRDDGPGFDVRTVPDSKDPTVLEREGGHGLVLMQTFMDEVHFNERGNEVTMVKRRESCRRVTP